MEERNTSRRPRREKAEEQPRNESLVYGKNPVTELLKNADSALYRTLVLPISR